eukprot:m.55481 g.55481  ORF g.55481 m.55481 type:complete len:771 (-) comp7607_c0_seq1:1586-3898(-)
MPDAGSADTSPSKGGRWSKRRSRKVAPAPAPRWSVSSGLQPAQALALEAAQARGGQNESRADRDTVVLGAPRDKRPSIVHGVSSVGPQQLDKPTGLGGAPRVLTLAWPSDDGGPADTDTDADTGGSGHGASTSVALTRDSTHGIGATTTTTAPTVRSTTTLGAGGTSRLTTATTTLSWIGSPNTGGTAPHESENDTLLDTIPLPGMASLTPLTLPPIATTPSSLGGGGRASALLSPGRTEFALLDDLEVSTGLLSPPFAPDRLIYTLYLRSQDPTVVITPAAPAAECSVDGIDVDHGEGIAVTADTVRRVLVHVRASGGPPTPYLINAVVVPDSAYEALLAGDEAECVPLHPAPAHPPAPGADASTQWYRARMSYTRADGGGAPLERGAVVAVSDTARDNASGWWAVREGIDGGHGVRVPHGPFYWVPAMCLEPVKDDAATGPSTSLDDAGDADHPPNHLLRLLSRIVKVPSDNHGSTESDILEAMTTMGRDELDRVESMLKPRRTGTAAAHQALHYPYFSVLLAVVWMCATIGTLARFGVTTLTANPFAGAPWRGIRLSGGCWPPDVFDGHIYQLFTALIIPAGLFSLAFDLILLRLIVVRQERVYGFARIGATFLLCGAAGHLTAVVFAPRWIGTGPEPGLIAVMTVLAVELALDGKRLRLYWMDAMLLVAAFAGVAVLGGLPGLGLWALLGGSVAAGPAALMYSRRLTRDGRGRRLAWACGVALAFVLGVTLITTFWAGTDGHSSWCSACERACYPVHDWCDPTNLS